jgi:hypothetical protein
VLITLASPAPMSVPAKPKNEATTAADTAASALAATWTRLRAARGGSSAGVLGRGFSVRLTVMELRGGRRPKEAHLHRTVLPWRRATLGYDAPVVCHTDDSHAQRADLQEDTDVISATSGLGDIVAGCPR